MRTKIAILAAAATALMSTAAIAHDEYSIAGKITVVSPQQIQVATANGQVAKLKLDKDTRVMVAGKRASPKDLKVGQTVKALGIGDTRLDVVALDVVIQPAPGGAG